MRYFQRRRYRKFVKHLLHEAAHAKHMTEDIAEEQTLKRLEASRHALLEAWDGQNPQDIERCAEMLNSRIVAIHPERSFPWMRENLEILLVAVAVAMAFRTYFVQPFKIPTGSMQPTLYGIHYQPKTDKTFSNTFPLNLLRTAIFGKRYIEIRALNSGRVQPHVKPEQDHFLVYVDNVPHKIYPGLHMYFRPGEAVATGQILASGERTIGDHIFVDKVRYNFTQPERGDIIVFDTSGIKHEQIRPDTFYIKRCAGLPGEAISIDPPYLLADGEKVTEPYGFQRLVEDHRYNGYQLARKGSQAQSLLNERGSVINLAADEYLPFGDNTSHSLDGRYFGPIKREHIVGPAFAVYWPLSNRWGGVK